MCPAVTLHKWKKDWHWIQKYHNFYISNCLCWLLFRNTLISWESLSADRISVFNPLGFSSFDYHLRFQLSNALCITAKHDLSCTGSSAFSNEPPSFFHIIKLQFYSHIFKFRFLLLNPLKKSNSTSSYVSSNIT